MKAGPTRYHLELRAVLEAEEPGSWRWFSSDDYETEDATTMRLELLRSSYRLTADAHERPHRLARQAAGALGISVPITLYQLHREAGTNAALFFEPDMAHVAMSGPLLECLDDDELTALFGHELAHHRLWTVDGGAHRCAARLVAHAATRGTDVWAHTAIRGQLWTEVACDRAAMAVTSFDAAVRCLVKVETGLTTVSVRDYLAQARELAESGRRRTPLTASHPEGPFRALALALYDERGDEAEDEIARLIDGTPTLETLDVVARRNARRLTRGWIAAWLAPSWARTERVVAHARAFFPEGMFAEGGDPTPELCPAVLLEYCAYILLDLAVVDPALEDVALARSLVLAREWGAREAFVAAARKELKQTVAGLGALERRADDLFEAAARAAVAAPEDART